MNRRNLIWIGIVILSFMAGAVSAQGDPDAKIYWVTEDLGGGNSDQGFVDLLTNAGYTVDMTFNDRQLRVLEDSELETLNRADLIIFSRDTDSRQYDDGAAEKAAWNSKIARPIINLNAFYMQANRWNWVPASDTWHYDDGPMRVLEPDHPVMEGVTITDGLVDVVTTQTTFPKGATDAAGGTLIGVREDNGFVWLATWDTTQNISMGFPPAGPRMLFCCGLDEATTGKQPVLPGSGTYNLTEEGSKIFLNAVKYMLDFALAKAAIPSPEDGAVLSAVSLELGWAPADGTASDNVYFGDDLEAVTNATTESPEFKQNQVEISYQVDGLVPGKTYYWRIDGVKEDDPDNPLKGEVWSFFIAPLTAYDPSPVNEARLIGLEPTLAWRAGVDAQAHLVYFGTSAAAVANADQGSPEYKNTLLPDITTWQPVVDGFVTLEPNTRYYWRVDEEAPNGTQKGTVWSFDTTLPGLGTCTRETWTGIESREVDALRNDPRFPDSPTETSEQTLFDSLNADLGDWQGARVKAWLQVPFTGDYSFKFSSYSPAELWLSTVPGDQSQKQLLLSIAIERLPRNDWRFSAEPVSLEAGKRYYIEALWVTTDFGDHCQVAWEGPGIRAIEVIQGGYLEPFEELWARSPMPANQAALVPQSTLLQWIPGSKASQHLLYLGTDANAVATATPESEGVYQGDLTDPNFPVMSLEWGTTYYWRVDEINSAEAGSPWVGPVWSFTTADYAVLENFESYTGQNGQKIWRLWTDGFGGNGTGSRVDYEDAEGNSLLETTIVHNGLQSMPLQYTNDGSLLNWEGNPVTASYSSTTLPLDPARDWNTVDGHTIDALSLWIHGSMQSPTSVTYEEASDAYTLNSAGGNFGGSSDQGLFTYQSLNGDGSITARIDTVELSADNAKVGLMIRDTLDADGPAVMINYQPRGRVQMIARSATGAASTATNSPIGGVTAPIWLRLTREGGLFSGAYSTDGTTWMDVLDETFGPAQFFVTMPDEVLIGMASSPQLTDDPAATAAATLSQVSTTGTVTPGTFDQSADIGLAYNNPDDLYLVVEDQAGNSVSVAHPDNPNAVVTAEWMQWIVDLEDLTGIDVGSVASLTISIGDPESASSETKGVVYVDDIGLLE